MSNILITPAAANRPRRSAVRGGYRALRRHRGRPRFRHLHPGAQREVLGHSPTCRVGAGAVHADESSRVVALRSGEIDVIDSITPDSADQIAGLSGVTIDRADGVRLNQLFYNFRKPAGSPMADARVRRALTYAIDGKSLIDDVMQGSATASKGVIPRRLDGAIETGEYVYDPARARKRTRRAGSSRSQSQDHLGERRIRRRHRHHGSRGADALGGGRAPEPATVQARRRHLHLASGQGRRLGCARQRLPQPHRPGAHDHAGHVRRHRRRKEATRDTYHGYIFPEITASSRRRPKTPMPARRAALLADAQRLIWDTCPMMWSFVPRRSWAGAPGSTESRCAPPTPTTSPRSAEGLTSST